MKIKVGEYIRTKTGYIDKIKRIVKVFDNTKYYILDNHDIVFKERIAKYSKNIIDLIEVGDYVNGHRVIEIDNKDKNIFNKYLVVEETDYDNYNISYSNNDIKSIVTREMFESIKYEV